MPGTDLLGRAERTLRVYHEWGYAPTLETLADGLIGGRSSTEELKIALRGSGRVTFENDLVCLQGSEELLYESHRRLESNRRLNGSARRIALEFTEDLVGYCPFVQCVTLSGSVSSGGYDARDDIDFDLFVRPGTKYICYLIATLVGLKYSWRYRQRPVTGANRTPFLPKVICINVVWPEDEARPFARQDLGLAFELNRSEPIYGNNLFQDILDDNPWIDRYFPQIYERLFATEIGTVLRPTPGLFRAVASRPNLLRVLETVSRWIGWMLYSYVHWTRRGNEEAVKRMKYIMQVKWPYEVFQD